MSESEILATDSPALFERAVSRAAELLRSGQVVAVPTETVYGLAANAFDSDAVAKIFEVKGRPGHNPVIVHIVGYEMASRCVAEWPLPAQKLAEAFWPGPLTVVLPKAESIPAQVTAGGNTVGIRWPSHPFMQALIRECGFPLAAPSANPSNQLSPTSAWHVHRQLGTKLPLIVDGGPSHVGIESTVVDLTNEPPRVLRPGIIHERGLRAVLGAVSGTAAGAGSAILKSPGLLKKHYAPRARLCLWQWTNEAELQAQIRSSRVREEKVFVIAHSRIPINVSAGRVSVIPHDPEAFARAIYSELHACDEGGALLIVVESLPPGVEWDALRDRLNRAAQ